MRPPSPSIYPGQVRMTSKRRAQTGQIAGPGAIPVLEAPPLPCPVVGPRPGTLDVRRLSVRAIGQKRQGRPDIRAEMHPWNLNRIVPAEGGAHDTQGVCPLPS